LVGAGGRS